MKKLILSILAAAVSVSAFAVAPSDFKKKVPITVNAEAVGDKTATDIPVLVKISTAIDGFSYSDMAADGSDLAFGVEDGGVLTVYPHEIDTWNTEGESLVWVKVPALSSSMTFDMYYGNGASSGVAAANTWSGYVGVWHLNETNATSTAYSYGEYKNSTATEGINGNLADKSIPNEVGKFGKSFRVNDSTTLQKGNFNYGGVWVPGTDALKLGSTFAIAGWFKNAANGFYYDHLFYKRSASGNTGGYTGAFAIEVAASSGTTFKIDARGNSTGKTVQTVKASPFADWVYMTFVYDEGKCHIYANGAFVGDSIITAASDNNAALCFGNNSNLADGSVGDAAWSGWIDEVRLRDATPDADWIALEYAAMGDGMLAYGSVITLDATMPKLESMSATVAEGSVTIIANFSGNMPADDSVTVTVGGTEYPMSTAASTVPATYTAIINSLDANQVYDYTVTFRSVGGNTSFRDSTNPFYTGAVSAAKVCDADEQQMESGFFRLSIPSAVASDIMLTYATSGTAVAGESYEELSGTATIPAGSTSVDVEVVPVYSVAVASNVTVVITVNSGSVIGGSSAELTVQNASVNPYVRYISTTGSDENDGLSAGSPMATVTNAIASLDSVSSDHDCTIYVAAGTYDLDASPLGSTEWSVVLTGRITVRGMTDDAKDVVFRRTNKACGLFRLNNEKAGLKNITITGGKCWSDNKPANGIQKGAGVSIDNGFLEDCVVTEATGPAFGQSGIGVYLKCGRVSRCRITSCSSSNSSQSGTGLYVESGIAEDSLIDSCTCGDSGAVFVKGGATLLNCTVANNNGALWSGVRVEKATAKVVNCAIFNNTVRDNTYGGVYTSGFGAAYHNCAADVAIVGGDNCILCQPRFRDFAGKDFVPSAGSKAIDAGTSRGTYGAVSTTDLFGNPRENGTVDIGCFENTKSVAEVALEWSADSQVVPSVLSLEAASIGIDAPVYSWTIHNNDTGVDVVKTGATTSVDDLTAGTYTISVSAGDCSYTSPQKYTVSPKDLYVVADNANAEFPYDTAAKAAANIQTALTAAGDTAVIHVQNGTYPISSQLKIDKAVRIVGESRNGVIVTNTADATSTRVFYLNNKDAKVMTMTITGGRVRSADQGANIYFSGNGGMVSNCLISAGLTLAQYNQGSGAAYMNAGVLTHCEITDCTAMPSASAGCTRTVYLTKRSDVAPRLSNCLIHDCDGSNGGSKAKGGELVTLTDYCLVDNCTIVDCVSYAGSSLIYCKASNNSYAKSGHIVNCVIFGRDAAGSKAKCAGGDSYNNAKWPQLYYNCVTEEQITDGTNIGHDCVEAAPSDCFKDYAAKDYSVKNKGPLYNAGDQSEYSLPFPACDFKGVPRVIKNRIDIGCYEGRCAGMTLLIK